MPLLPSALRLTRGTRRLTAVTAALALTPLTVGSGPLSPAAHAAPGDAPSLRIGTSETSVVARRVPGDPVYVSLPFYVTTVGGTLDLRVHRDDYDHPLTVTQVVHHDDGTESRIPIDLEVANLRGFKRFLRLTVTDADGTVVSDSRRRFCPNDWEQQRLDPDGSDVSTFPDGCWGMPFSLGSAWGIDEGWATRGFPRFLRFKAPNGHYTVTASVTAAYREALGIAEEDASSSIDVRVRNGESDIWERSAPRQRHRALPRNPQTRILADPPAGHLPDLRVLPAFGLRVRHKGDKDRLSFGANVWVGGDARLDIEGFRRQGEDLMDAYQYFYDGDEVLGKAEVGTLEFDRRDGHHHWHLEQFARYRLLAEDLSFVAKSKKQSFCIVPTDPVDLSLDAAERRPWSTGLGSACGAEEALWIRETLPVGWGDTYYQSRAGQSFNITDVPNGTYYVAVETNPTGELFESDTTNNQSLREVRITGRPGHRKICVPAVSGIDPEGNCS